MQDTRVVQQKIQSAKAAYGLVQQATDFARFRNVGWERECKVAKLASNLFDAIPSPADQRDPRTIAGQSDGACASDSTARTRDDSNLAS
jgi:hypothetical protein